MPVGPDRTPRHPIGVVSARTGLPQDVLRIWERRYRAVVPQRTETRRRLYSDHDLERFRLLKRLVDGGRRISDVASLSFEDLEALAREDAEQSAAPPRRPRRNGDGPPHRLEEILEAAAALDGDRLARLVEQAAVEMGAANARREIVVPLLRAIGDRWREGTLRIASEHLATSVLRTLLIAAQRQNWVGSSAPSVLIATLPGCRHELGALLAAVVATEIGWEAVYVGPDLPPEEIAAAARMKGARAIAISLVFPAADVSVQSDLRALRRAVGDEVPLLVGGAAAASYDDVLADIGARRVEDLASFQERLESLR